jgi:predicted NAD/FAD-binding protein
MRVAVVGTGVAGLAASYWLHRRHDLTVFEANDWIGGHVHTVPVRLGRKTFHVDTGFIVFNERTYPLFCGLLRRLGVRSRPTDMSFSVRCEGTGLEYGGASLRRVFAQRRNLLRPSFHRMLRDVRRFQRESRRLLEAPDAKVTLGDYLAGAGYSSEFVEAHLLPMAAAIWSTDPQTMRDFPAQALVRFFENHGLLQLRGGPRWRTIEGGSFRYVERLVAGFRDRIRLSEPVERIVRERDGVTVLTRSGAVEHFDQIVLATHSDQALSLLAEPSGLERRVLGSIRYRPNEAVLHTDASILPRTRRAWASWNYHLLRERPEEVALTYHMNRLQHLDAPEELCVTLNRTDAIDPSRVIARMTYHHPLLDGEALRAQEAWRAVSGRNRTHYCGAYWGYGFHEDGVRSALRVVRSFGREREA